MNEGPISTAFAVWFVIINSCAVACTRTEIALRAILACTLGESSPDLADSPDKLFLPSLALSSVRVTCRRVGVTSTRLCC